MPAALPLEHWAALNGLIRAQSVHLRRSLLGMDVVSLMCIVQSDPQTLFLQMHAFGFHDVGRPAIPDHPEGELFLWWACSSGDQLLQVAVPALTIRFA